MPKPLLPLSATPSLTYQLTSLSPALGGARGDHGAQLGGSPLGAQQVGPVPFTPGRGLRHAHGAEGTVLQRGVQTQMRRQAWWSRAWAVSWLPGIWSLLTTPGREILSLRVNLLHNFSDLPGKGATLGTRSLRRLLRVDWWYGRAEGREGRPGCIRGTTDWGGGRGWGAVDRGLCASLPGDPESKCLSLWRLEETEAMLTSLSVETAAVAQHRERRQTFSEVCTKETLSGQFLGRGASV